MQTLDEFLMQRKRRNANVTFPGFNHLYVRHNKRFIIAVDRLVSPVLDLANIEATRPGNGAFTLLFNHVRTTYPLMWIYVECVLNRRFEEKLHKMGFTLEKQTITPSFYMPPAKEVTLEVPSLNEEP